MIFKIYNTGGYTSEKGLINDYPILLKYSYHGEHEYFGRPAGYIVINSLEELVKLTKDLDIELIIDSDEPFPTIEIYDDFRE